MKSIILKINTFCIVLVLFTVCPSAGQTVKKVPVSSADYSQWHTMDNEMLSDDGKWASYTMCYEANQDTTFVKEIKGKHISVFPQGKAAMFKGKWFSCMQDNELHLLNLNSMKTQIFKDVTQYAFAFNDGLVLRLKENKQDFMILINSEGTEIQRFENAMFFYLNHATTEMILFQSVNNISKISIVNVVNGAVEIIKTFGKTALSNVTWADNGNAVAFLDTVDSTQTLSLYRKKGKQLFHLQLDTTLKSNVVSGISQVALVENGKELLFWIQKKQTNEEQYDVNVWNTQDDILQVNRSKYRRGNRTLCKWTPDLDYLQVYANKELFRIAADASFAIRRDYSSYVPSSKLVPDADYYFVDLKSGKEKLIMKEYSGAHTMLLVPNAQSILYFKEANWWYYNYKADKHTNLTAQLPVSFLNDMYEKADANFPIAHPIIADNEQTLLLYDTNDIWKLDPQSGIPIRLTKGKEKKLIYRVAEVNLIPKKELFWLINKPKAYKNKQALLLNVSSEDNSEYGFGWLKNEKISSKVCMIPMRINIKARAKESRSFIFSEESFDMAPRLMYWEPNNAKATKVVQSNPQQDKYAWGKAEFVDYTNNAGKLLKGVLFHPANFEPNYQYPMVVSVYQKQGYSRHLYCNPTFYNSTGFNVTNLTSQGYFVFLPDIIYERNNPGYSALDCVMTGVDAALQNRSIDKGNVGLIGHSFGGYETNFIITQTPFFKTAIAGAGITDLTSRYLSISENHLASETWRFEYGQYRMAGPLFNNRENYHSNSPIEYVEKVTSSLLSWTGERDTQVNSNQTMKFYSAMRRLRKPHIMLSYPNEDHVLQKPEKQKDLTIKMEEWLDYHLKKGEEKTWMEVNFQYKRR